MAEPRDVARDEYADIFPGRHFISSVLSALDTKVRMSGEFTRRYLQRAAMAGVIIGVFYVTNYAIVNEFAKISVGDVTLQSIGRLVGGFCFGFALVFIYYTRSELLTSNMMITSIGVYHRRTTVGRASKLLGLCLLGNFFGGLFIALPYKMSTIISGGTHTAMADAVTHKLDYVLVGASGWLDLLARATMCNFMINLAMLLVYNGIIKDDLTKCLVMIMSVFVFAFLGFEHSVANTVLFTIMGVQDGIALGPALANVALALIGNFFGGGILIGVYYAWVNDERGVRPR